jgi:hypothetical protein
LPASFALLALSSYFFSHHECWPIWLGLSIAFAIVDYVAPPILGPSTAGGPSLACCCIPIVSPIILGFIFFCCIVPIGFLMRQFGNDPLRRWELR